MFILNSTWLWGFFVCFFNQNIEGKQLLTYHICSSQGALDNDKSNPRIIYIWIAAALGSIIVFTFFFWIILTYFVYLKKIQLISLWEENLLAIWLRSVAWLTLMLIDNLEWGGESQIIIIVIASLMHNALVPFYRFAVIAYLLSSNYVVCGLTCPTCSSCVNVNRNKETSYGSWLALLRFLLSNPTCNGVCHFINCVLFSNRE